MPLGTKNKDADGPVKDLGHPASVVDLVTSVLQIFYLSHGDKHGEEEEVVEADYEQHIGLKPLMVRRLVKVVNPMFLLLCINHFIDNWCSCSEFSPFYWHIQISDHIVLQESKKKFTFQLMYCEHRPLLHSC
uniref:Uncharacterized protein n=1 Tax=Arundo donax TaxID=35708 RepID=A0A0A9CT70_ARUDO